MRVLLAVLICLTAVEASAQRRICYKTTSLMWDAAARRPVPTSPEMLERLHQAFRLWERASAGALRLDYRGFTAASIDSAAQLPQDGCVHAVLYGEQNFHGELAHGLHIGTIPDQFKLGYFFVSRNPAASDSSTLIHEIGHALGLPHSATPASVMFSGPRAGGRDAPPELPKQDQADLRARWAPGSSGLYSISGTIVSGREHPMAFVFARRVDGGAGYSSRADHQGKFSIALLQPGRYTLVAKPITVSRDLNPEALGGMSDSWFVSNGVSAAEPTNAAVLELSVVAPSVSGLRFKTLDLAAPPPAPRSGQEFPVPVLPAASSGGRPPVVRLSFDSSFDDEGPFHFKGKVSGDEMRLVPGVRGRALFVGGTEDWLDLALSNALSFEKGFSLELWFRRDDWENPYKGGSGWQTIAALSGGASLSITAPGCPLHKPWALQGDVSGIASKSAGSTSAHALSAPDQPARKWTHAALTYEPANKTLTLYMDGTPVERTKGAPTPSFTWGNLRLGTWHKANQAFRGELDEVEVYDYPRPASAIAAATGQPLR